MSEVSRPIHLSSTYVQLLDGGAARLLEVTDSFWPDVMAGKRPDIEPGRMVSMFSFSENWRMWERHPAGDELVILVSGSVEFLLDLPGGVTRTKLDKPGELAIVPKNTWHTAHTSGCSMLFVTPGEGTDHKDL